MVSPFTKSLRAHLGLPPEGNGSQQQSEHQPHQESDVFSYFRQASNIQRPAKRESRLSQNFFENLRRASVTQADHWKVFRAACSFPNTIDEHPSTGLHNRFCQRCSVSLRFTEDARPVIVQQPLSERLKEARAKNDFRSASAQNDDVPFWTIRPETLH